MAYLNDTERWPGLRSIGMVEAERKVGGQLSTERRSSITSLLGDARFRHGSAEPLGSRKWPALGARNGVFKQMPGASAGLLLAELWRAATYGTGLC